MNDEEMTRRMIKLMGKLERGEIEPPEVCFACLEPATTKPRRFHEHIVWICSDCDWISERVADPEEDAE